MRKPNLITLVYYLKHKGVRYRFEVIYGNGKLQGTKATEDQGTKAIGRADKKLHEDLRKKCGIVSDSLDVTTNLVKRGQKEKAQCDFCQKQTDNPLVLCYKCRQENNV